MAHANNLWTRVWFAQLVGAAALAFAARHAAAAQYDLVMLNASPLGGGQAFGIDNGHAVGDVQGVGGVVWTDPNHYTVLSPSPAGAVVNAVSGNQQAGWIPVNSQEHAALWSGSSGSVVDLSTAGAGTSFALATDGTQQVGATGAGAALWSGTAASYVNLGPNNYPFSEATGVWNGVQVGWGGDSPASNNADALLWHGTASSVSVLRTAAKAFAIHGTQAVGWTAGAGLLQGSLQDACMWTNATPQSFLDLAPSGTTASKLTATNGTLQVGDVSFEFGGATLPLDHHAGVWSGTASSFQMLPVPSGDNFSFATGIDAQSNISGYVGTDINGGLGALVPVVWQPVPEAGSMAIIGFAAAALLPLRRRGPRGSC